MVNEYINNSNDYKNIDEKKLNLLLNDNYNYFKKKNYSELKKNILTILKTYYQTKDKENLFNKCIDNNDILIDNKSTKKIAHQNGYSIPKDVEGYYISNKPQLNFNDLSYKPKKNIIIVGKEGKKSNLLFLDQISHEIRHAMTNINDTNIFLDEDIFYERIGLTEILTDEYGNSLTMNDLLDEFYNTYFNEIIINEILRYNNIQINNTNISNYLKSLKNEYKNEYYYSMAYSEIRKICYPMLYNKELNEITEDVTFNGNLDILYDYYRSKNVDFEEFSDNIDDFQNNIQFLKEKSLILGGKACKKMNF